MTEMILADEAIVWTPWRGAKLHSVDLGYDLEGNLIGIKIWDTVAKRDN